MERKMRGAAILRFSSVAVLIKTPTELRNSCRPSEPKEKCAGPKLSAVQLLGTETAPELLVQHAGGWMASFCSWRSPSAELKGPEVFELLVSNRKQHVCIVKCLLLGDSLGVTGVNAGLLPSAGC